MSRIGHTRLSRRDFLRVSALTGAAAIVSACVPQTSTAPTIAPAAPTTAPPDQATPEAAPTLPTAAAITQFREAAMLAEMVARGELPPVEERLPLNPFVLAVYDRIGTHGGNWNRAYLGVSDRFGVHTTIAEHLLETYQPAGGDLVLIPNVAESFEVNEDGTEFTWHLREGMKWSDGVPLSSENAVWWYENIYLNEEIAPGRLYDNVRQQQDLMSIEAVDPLTFVCSYSTPNGTLPLGVVRGEAWGLIGGLNFLVPSHYLQNYHRSFADPAELQRTVEQFRLQTWSQLFLEGPIAMFALNPQLPVVGPWVTQTPAASARMTQMRNPYYFKVDPEGNQLPYIDTITHNIFEGQESFNIMLVSGEIDCQFRHVQLRDYTLLKENESRGNYAVYVWRDDGNYGYMVNPTPRDDNGVVDEAQSAIVSRADFRRALSLAINREEINELLFNGLSSPRGSAPVPGSPVYKEEYETLWAEHDPEQANALLDGLGLTNRDRDGFRLRPDGQTLTVRLDVDSVPGSIFADMNELVRGYWEAIGIRTLVNTMERSLRETVQFSDRYSVVAGGTANTALPLSYDAWHNTIGGGWGRYLRNPADPLAIAPPEDDEEIQVAMQCTDLILEAYGMSDIDAAHAKLMEALDIYYDQCYQIGIVGANPVPGVVHSRMKNVPQDLVWANALMRVDLAQPPQFFIEE